MSRRRIRLSAPLLILVVASALLATACGDDGEADSTGVMKRGATTTTGAGHTTTPSAKVAAVKAELRVVLTEIGSKTGAGIPLPSHARCTRSIPATCTALITCPTVEDATDVDEQLCRWMAETPASVIAPPADDAGQVCTEIYGGPELAHVTGMRDGQAIDVRFSRTNGCEIARWDAASPLWTGQIPAPTDGAPPVVSSPPATSTEPEIITDPIKPLR